MELSLDSHTDGPFDVIEVGGEIDVYTAPRLREAIVAAIEADHTRLIIDVEKVEFLDSTGLGVLVGAHKRLRAAGGTFGLVCAKEPLLKIFRITALNQVFPLYDTVEAATGADAGPAA